MGDDGWQDMPSLISRETSDAVVSAIGEFVVDQTQPFAIVLHGGEPLMMGDRRLGLFLAALRSKLAYNYPISIQTNGILLTRKIADICAHHKVSISISLDGPQPVNDKFRIGKRGEGTHERVAAGIEVLRNHSESEFLYAGLLSVVDPASNPLEIYKYLKGLEPPSVDFLYRDGNHTNLPYGKESFTSTEYGDWMGRLLDVYLADPSPLRIRFLDDIIKLSLGGRGIKEGLGGSEYAIAIIETDGTISKNDTLKSTFDGADRFTQVWSVKTHRLADVFRSTEFKEYHSLQRPTSVVCNSCSYLNVCGGGMPLHRWKLETRYDNSSVYCNDQKFLISKVVQQLQNEGLTVDSRLVSTSA